MILAGRRGVLCRIGEIEINSSGNADVSYAYAGGRVLTRTYDLTNDIVSEIEYNDLGQAERRHTYEVGTPDTTIVDFGYTFDDNGNIEKVDFDHRTSNPYNDYTYDTLDRLERSDYLVGVNGNYEIFPYDDLGNRDGSVNFYNSADVLQSSTPYAVDDETNRYTAISSTSVTHDDAGNLYRGYFLS